MSRPHIPEILDGLSDRFWFLAILIVTGWKHLRKVEQHRVSPQGPIPPRILVSSRGPICRISIRTGCFMARSETSFR